MPMALKLTFILVVVSTMPMVTTEVEKPLPVENSGKKVENLVEKPVENSAQRKREQTTPTRLQIGLVANSMHHIAEPTFANALIIYLMSRL